MVNVDKCTCVGCGACADICPKSCIKMQPNEEGFNYPVIDKQSCISCNKCESVCPAVNEIESLTPREAWAAYSKNEAERSKSSSGAVFYELANRVLENRGVVIGAAFGDGWKVEHIAVESIDDLPKLQTSKYVQSDTNGIFRKTKAFLEAERQVMFVGTPCQCNALNCFLNKKYDNLLLIDFICHGVPSPMVWQKYLKSISNDEVISHISFRDKTDGWKSYNHLIQFSDNMIKQPYYTVSYMNLFLNDLILRKSCYNCNSKFPHKSSDITLGDLWGAEHIVPEMDDDKGLSLVIVNTKKGQDYFGYINESIISKTIQFKDAVNYNPSAVSSCDEPENRTKLFREIINSDDIDFDIITEKYIKQPKSIKKTVKKIIKRILKKGTLLCMHI